MPVLAQPSLKCGWVSLQVVKWFWEVLHGLPQEQQKQLLFFVTGSDRVPIKGLASLSPPFTISRAGPHSDRLPTAHTCFNHLLLPDYQVCAAYIIGLWLAVHASCPTCPAGKQTFLLWLSR